MELWNNSCHVSRAQATQSAKLSGFSLMISLCTVCRVSSGWAPGRARVFSLKLGSSTYWLAVSGAWVKVPSNMSLAHCRVCSMALGKFFSVQIGIDFSGGS